MAWNARDEMKRTQWTQEPWWRQARATSKADMASRGLYNSTGAVQRLADVNRQYASTASQEYEKRRQFNMDLARQRASDIMENAYKWASEANAYNLGKAGLDHVPKWMKEAKIPRWLKNYLYSGKAWAGPTLGDPIEQIPWAIEGDPLEVSRENTRVPITALPLAMMQGLEPQPGRTIDYGEFDHISNPALKELNNKKNFALELLQAIGFNVHPDEDLESVDRFGAPSILDDQSMAEAGTRGLARASGWRPAAGFAGGPQGDPIGDIIPQQSTSGAGWTSPVKKRELDIAQQNADAAMVAAMAQRDAAGRAAAGMRGTGKPKGPSEDEFREALYGMIWQPGQIQTTDAKGNPVFVTDIGPDGKARSYANDLQQLATFAALYNRNLWDYSDLFRPDLVQGMPSPLRTPGGMPEGMPRYFNWYMGSQWGTPTVNWSPSSSSTSTPSWTGALASTRTANPSRTSFGRTLHRP